MQKVSKYKIAGIYAQAWLEAAKDKKSEDKAFKEVGLLLASVENNAPLWNKLSAPIEDNKVLNEIITGVSKKIKLSEVSSNALLQIAENGRLKFLKLILEEFINRYYKDKNILRVDVDTAVALTETQDKKLKQTLEKKLNKEILLIYHIKPEVLGGLAVRYGSFLIDDTLSARLKRVEQAMAAK